MEITQEMLQKLSKEDYRYYLKTGVYRDTPEEVQFIDTPLNNDPTTFLNGAGKFTTPPTPSNPSSSGVVEVTYGELVELISTSGLTIGSQYKISDFRTRHYIVDADGNRYFGDGNEITGDLEPLIVSANGIASIDKEAKSEIYPQDVIYYDWNPNNWLTDMSFADADDTSSVIITDFKGVITYRHDTILDNSTCYDFRNVKFRRWEVLVPEWSGTTTYQTGDFVKFQGFVYKTFPTTGNTNNLPELESNNWIRVLDLSKTTFWNVYDNNMNGIPSNPNVYGDFKTFAEGSGNATYEFSCRSNHIEGLNDDSNTWMSNATRLSNIVFFLKNSNSYSLYNNKIGSGSYGNTFCGDYIYNNNISNSFSINLVTNLSYCTIDSTCRENIIFGAHKSRIETNSFRNVISSYFSQNYIGSGCGDNYFGYNIQYNTFGQNFSSNVLGCYSYKNTFGNNIWSGNFIKQTVNPYSAFINNYINNDLNFTGIDFSSSTHVYGDYSTEIVKAFGGSIKLMYVDNGGVQQIVSVNS